MNWLKKLMTKIVLAVEYEPLHTLPKQSILFNNFTNLAKAYEQSLNAANYLILPNENRPKLLARLLGTSPSEAYFIIQALAQTKNLEGDVCEFGVAQGETSALIANEIAASNKILHLFDSFAGLPKPSEKDKLKDDIFLCGDIQAYEGKMRCPEDMVMARLQAISFPAERYVIHKGLFDRNLLDIERNLPQKVSFAYVDFDFYEPIKLALEFIDPLCPSGAIIIVDDYDFFSTGAKTAVDEFLQEINSSKVRYNCLIPKTEYGYFAVLTKN